jgi:hypothetical protein
MGSNIEAGVEIDGDDVREISQWFERLWNHACPLTIAELTDVQTKIAALRREYESMKKRTKSLFKPRIKRPAGSLTDSLQDLFETAPRFFVCNTDRRQGERTLTGRFTLEEEMCNRGFAAAWERFKYQKRMEQVEPGDGILIVRQGRWNNRRRRRNGKL